MRLDDFDPNAVNVKYRRDDTVMRSAGRRPVEASFTHGSSAQRVEALRRGLRSGDDTVCDAYVR